MTSNVDTVRTIDDVTEGNHQEASSGFPSTSVTVKKMMEGFYNCPRKPPSMVMGLLYLTSLMVHTFI